MKQVLLPAALLGEIVQYLDVTEDVFIPGFEKLWEKATQYTEELAPDESALFRYKNGKLHSWDDLPAVERSDGTRAWYYHDQCHRDGDKPAVECADNSAAWYHRGRVVKRRAAGNWILGLNRPDPRIVWTYITYIILIVPCAILIPFTMQCAASWIDSIPSAEPWMNSAMRIIEILYIPKPFVMFLVFVFYTRSITDRVGCLVLLPVLVGSMIVNYSFGYSLSVSEFILFDRVLYLVVPRFFT